MHTGTGGDFSPPYVLKKDKSMRKKFFFIILILISLGIASYPFISNYLYEHQADNKITVYQDKIKNTTKEAQEEMLRQAREYNAGLSQSQVRLTDPFAEEKRKEGISYDALLNPNGDGMMGYIEIPCIAVNLPVFHGTAAKTLETGIGHLEGSSLPVGGNSTHTVLTGHSGLNKAKLFTDLSEMQKGDLFFLHVAGKNLAYEVSEINIVLPEEVNQLLVVPGEDLATLVTCTPYGVNTHRLLVTGKRTAYTKDLYDRAQKDKKNTESMWMRTYRKAMVIGICIALSIVIVLKIIQKVRKGRK